MAGPHTPAITLSYPLMRDPVLSRPRRLPMTWYPFMAIANPLPIASQPYISRHRRYTDHFFAGRRGSHHDDAPRCMPLIGGDNTAGEYHGDQKRGSPTGNVRTHIDNQTFD
jgi:hypothetical protein